MYIQAIGKYPQPEQKENNIIFNAMGKPQVHYIKAHKLVTKKLILYVKWNLKG